MAQPDLSWYPGHSFLETALFGQDHSHNPPSLKLIDRRVHKRHLPGDSERDRIDFANDELYTSTESIPEGSLQMIRFTGLARSTPEELVETRRDQCVLASVFSTLGFPVHYARFALESPRTQHGRLLVGDESDISRENPAFYATGSRVCLIWRFDTATKTTRAVLVNYVPTVDIMIAGFMPILEMAMQPLRQCFGHPMFLRLLLVAYLRSHTMSTYDPDSNIMAAIESQVTLKSANRISTMQQLRTLGRHANTDKFILSAIRDSLDQARTFNELTYEDSGGHIKEPVARHFLAHVESQQCHLDLDIMWLASLQETIAHQRAALSTIVNMQDSTSMKTVAVITMAFLPGTFVASMFAMPEFPHDTFSQYWAVCVPLTAVVFLAWLTWFYWHTISDHSGNGQGSVRSNIKLWWADLNSRSLGEKDTSADYSRKQLAVDRYKEWKDGYNTARMEESGKPASAVNGSKSRQSKDLV